MGSALMAAAKAHDQAAVTPRQDQVTGTFVGRISSVRSDGVRVILPTHNGEREFGPCVLPIGLLGVGPAHADTTAGTAAARPVALTNAVQLVKGLQVLFHLPLTGAPWIIAIAPTGPGV